MSKKFVLNLGTGADIMDNATGAYTHEETEKEAIITGGFITVLAGNNAKQCSVQIPGATMLEYFNEVLGAAHSRLIAQVTEHNTVIITAGDASTE